MTETGGAGAQHLADYQKLDAMLDALVGNVDHQAALISFDSAPHLVVPFTPDTETASRGLATLSEGDNGAAILDAIEFAVEQLRAQPPKYRRAILLLSETVDQGSKSTLNDALRLVSDTNTTIYSLAFSSTRSAAARGLKDQQQGSWSRARLFQQEGRRRRVRRSLQQADSRLCEPARSSPSPGLHDLPKLHAAHCEKTPPNRSLNSPEANFAASTMPKI